MAVVPTDDAGKPRRRRHRLRRALAVFAALAVVSTTAIVGGPRLAPAQAAGVAWDPSAAQGEIDRFAAIQNFWPLLNIGRTTSSWPTWPIPETNGLEVGAFDDWLNLTLPNINIPILGLPIPDLDLGALGTIPLSEIFSLGDLGLMKSYAYAPSCDYSEAASGFLLADGSFDLGAPGYTSTSIDPAYIDLAKILTLIPPALGVLDQFKISFGGLGAWATSDQGDVDSGYMLGYLGLDAHSPLLSGLATTLAGLLSLSLAPVAALVDGVSGAALTALLKTTSALWTDLGLSSANGNNAPGAATQPFPLTGTYPSTVYYAGSGATVELVGLDTFALDVVNELLLQPLENTDGSISINLAEGSLHIDLAALILQHYNELNPLSQITSINDLPPNFLVFSPAFISMLIQGIGGVLADDGPNSLLGKIQSIGASFMDDLKLQFRVPFNTVVQTSTLGAARVDSGYVTFSGSLDDFSLLNLGSVATGLAGEVTITESRTFLTVATAAAAAVAAKTAGGVLVGGTPTATADYSTTAGQAAKGAIIADARAKLGLFLTGAAGVSTTLDLVLSTLNAVLAAPEIILSAVGDIIGALTLPFDIILNQVVRLVINEQDPGPFGTPDLGPGSFTVRALSVALFPGFLDFALIWNGFANASVKSSTWCSFIQKQYLDKTVDPNGIWKGLDGASFEIFGNLVDVNGQDTPDDANPIRFCDGTLATDDTLNCIVTKDQGGLWSGDEVGVWMLSSLPPGTYWLGETKAPPGYSLLAAMIKVIVHDGEDGIHEYGELEIIDGNMGSNMGKVVTKEKRTVAFSHEAKYSKSDKKKKKYKDDPDGKRDHTYQNVIVVRDVPLIDLPATGGPGMGPVWRLAGAASALTIAAWGAWWLVGHRRRKGAFM